MLKYSDMQGAIFDVDDTLLSNYPPGYTHGLHEISRVEAAHVLGKKYDIQALQDFTLHQGTVAFRTAKVHTLQAAVWQMLVMANVVAPTDNIETEHPLLIEMMSLKEQIHEEILRSLGREVPGAAAFVKNLQAGKLADKLAVASTSNRRDIKIFFEMTGLDKVFPDERLISRDGFTHAKPHPEPFNIAYATLGLPESARPFVAAFEDDPRGIMSAKAAGLFTCAITTRYSVDELAALEVAPDLIAHSYAEFAELLKIPRTKAK